MEKNEDTKAPNEEIICSVSAFMKPSSTSKEMWALDTVSWVDSWDLKLGRSLIEGMYIGELFLTEKKMSFLSALKSFDVDLNTIIELKLKQSLLSKTGKWLHVRFWEGKKKRKLTFAIPAFPRGLGKIERLQETERAKRFVFEIQRLQSRLRAKLPLALH